MFKLFRRILFLLTSFLTISAFVSAAELLIVRDGCFVPVILATPTGDPVPSALALLGEDVKDVTGSALKVSSDYRTFDKNEICLIVGTIGKNKKFDRFLKKNKISLDTLIAHPESYRMQVISTKKSKAIVVVGGDDHGTAYGLLDFSQMIGVSPWKWWADAVPVKQNNVEYPESMVVETYPSVRYRGIFLNDEDWGLMPWASQTLAPGSPKGTIGPKAYERICQLLLRLSANLLWPAMHECTKPFYLVPGNYETAAKYGIYIGTSHCEPLLCNIANEWKTPEFGEYNYKTNSPKVLDYWSRRVDSTKNTPAIYTIGMRGLHDGNMLGTKTVDESRELLQKVINDQRNLLSKTIGKPLKDIPQVFIPYKEVLDVYDSGLQVPEDISLIWCDDNYGYISRLSNAQEQKRSGGAGVYYHVSYWGRPHDYLWLASTTPALINYEMTRAWQHGAQKLWVLNVGDIKPAEYLLEYYLGLAWAVGKSWKFNNEKNLDEPPFATHLYNFMEREFGEEFAKDLSDIMQQYYLLATQRKPEHMAWTRVEEPGYPGGKTPVTDSDLDEKEALARINKYATLEYRVRVVEEKIPASKRATYFQLVSYPVYGASLLNQKLLYAQLSRQKVLTDTIYARDCASAARFAYNEIQRLTNYYCKEMSNGKWDLMMSSHPRDLNVFSAPVLPEIFKDIAAKPIITPRVVLRSQETSTEKSKSINLTESKTNNGYKITINASMAKPNQKVSGLGHSGSAIKLEKGETVEYRFQAPVNGNAEVSFCLLPLHAADGGDIRFEASLDGSSPEIYNIKTIGRSEEWKQNVLRNQSIRKAEFKDLTTGEHFIRIKALDEDVVVDQIIISAR
jgi:hypothetical protein